MPKKPLKRKRRGFKRYSIDQCLLYKTESIKKLAERLGFEKHHLESILEKPLEYREFLIPEEFNPFSLKKTKARPAQEPINDLRKIHERILYLLEPIELPNYAHAAVKKRSYRSNAIAHIGSAAMATFDLKNFYGSTQSQLVYYFFLDGLKCSPDVAGVLTKLTTLRNAMPTGSPLSPLLSLHASKEMLDKVFVLAESLGLIFTCYIDDLTLSGKIIPRFLEKRISRIIGLYGYQLSAHKTRIFGEDSVKHVTGVVINNGKLKVPRSRFRTSRNLESAISGSISTHGHSQLKLHEKLAGLLGETAFIDPSYKERAFKAQERLKAVRLDIVIDGEKAGRFSPC
jgi:RNA-directed DNA polymerase